MNDDSVDMPVNGKTLNHLRGQWVTVSELREVRSESGDVIDVVIEQTRCLVAGTGELDIITVDELRQMYGREDNESPNFGEGM